MSVFVCRRKSTKSIELIFREEPNYSNYALHQSNVLDIDTKLCRNEAAIF